MNALTHAHARAQITRARRRARRNAPIARRLAATVVGGGTGAHRYQGLNAAVPEGSVLAQPPAPALTEQKTSFFALEVDARACASRLPGGRGGGMVT
jgi:hypothetical protein